MFICNNVDNNGVLRVRFLKLNVYSPSKACPLALMQRVARVTMQSKTRWIVCWSMLRHLVTIASRSCLKLLGSHHAARSKFCNQFVDTVEQNPGFLDQLIVSDEAIFSLNSEITTRNVRKYAAHDDGTQPQTQNHNSLVSLNVNDCFPKVRKTKIKEHIHLSNVSIWTSFKHCAYDKTKAFIKAL